MFVVIRSLETGYSNKVNKQQVGKKNLQYDIILHIQLQPIKIIR